MIDPAGRGSPAANGAHRSGESASTATTAEQTSEKLKRNDDVHPDGRTGDYNQFIIRHIPRCCRTLADRGEGLAGWAMPPHSKKTLHGWFGFWIDRKLTNRLAATD